MRSQKRHPNGPLSGVRLQTPLVDTEVLHETQPFLSPRSGIRLFLFFGSRNKQPRLLARGGANIGHLTSAEADYKASPSFSVPCDPATPPASNYASLLFTRIENSIGMGIAKRLNAYLEQRRILINDVENESAFHCVPCTAFGGGTIYNPVPKVGRTVRRFLCDA